MIPRWISVPSVIPGLSPRRLRGHESETSKAPAPSSLCTNTYFVQQTHVNSTRAARRSRLSMAEPRAHGGILHAVGSNRRVACDRPLVAALSRGTLWAVPRWAWQHLQAAAFSQEIFRDPQYPYAISTMAQLLYPLALSYATAPIASHAPRWRSCFPFYPSSLALVSLPFFFSTPSK
ncbi:hypothetical protein BDP81DRAFT_197895 [Colletotrichum phormii]|uniref:Uncharacterized protein n=1 Tax=Colletotrichum phormii TaxID=359342 RepID=A0AAI9ZVU5_9PEZI|nr:uncharacterized protein BDP81DRAFT_197895 [Colletotrichum phormii]KAK1639154.1 hypothetical protein BDP81DRAFT_197895 [Colletotrichum phormii]